MDEPEAEAVLRGLAAPLAWEYHEYGSACVWSASACHDLEAPRYDCSVYAPVRVNLGTNENGDPFRWLLHVVRYGQGNTRWCFPCRTEAEGKGICERLVVSSDTAEVERRDRMRYPLIWEAGTSEDVNCAVARVCRRRFDEAQSVNVVRYLVVPEKQWFSRSFTAHYKAPTLNKEIMDWYVNPHLLRPRSHSPHRYKAAGEAKAACERHHWTGSWEG